MFSFLFSCIPQVPIESPPLDTESSFDTDYALITTASYSDGIGALATLNLDTYQVSDNLTQNIHSDAMTKISGDQVYQLNRLGMDALRIYDWGDWNTPKAEWHLGESSNPQDIEVCSDLLFISLYNSHLLPIYDHAGTLLNQLDLSVFVHPEDTDASPEASAMIAIGDQLYVALNQLHADIDFGPSGTGTVLQIDCTSQSIVQNWETPPNPSIYPSSSDTSLLVLSGSYGNRDGAIQRLDLETQTLSEPIIDNQELDIWLFGAAVSSSGNALLLGFDESRFESVLYCGALQSDTLIEQERSSLFFSHLTAYEDRGYLSTSEGLWIYDIDNCERLVDTPISFLLPPSHISFYKP